MTGNPLNNPLNLCFIADASNIAVRRWLTYFRDQGHTVVCLSDKEPSCLSEWVGIDIQSLPTRNSLLAEGQKADKLSVLRERTRVIQQHLATFQPDILHAHFLYQRGWSGALSNFHPYMVTLFGSDIHLPPQHYRTIFHHWRDVLLNALSLMQADFVNGVSADLCRIAQKLSLGQTPIELITIGADPQQFFASRGTPEYQEFRQSLNIDDDAFVVLSPRQITPLYRIDCLIDSIPAVLENFPDTVFVILNPFCRDDDRQNYVNKLKQRADKLGVNHAIRWVEGLDYQQMPYLYNVADVVVNIPKTDGMPASMLEAMACQKPVIAEDLPTYDEVLVHEESGLRLKSVTPSTLSDAIITMIKAPNWTKRLGLQGLLRFEKFGDFEANLQAMEAHYYRLTEQQRNRRLKQGLLKRLSSWFLHLMVGVSPS